MVEWWNVGRYSSIPVFQYSVLSFILFFFPLLWGGTEGGAFAQAPPAINYQAVARNPAGNPIINTSANIRFAIYSAPPLDTVWVETQSTTTNAFGLFNAEIGQGTKIGGSAAAFGNIKWGQGTFYLRVWVNGFHMGFTQFVSVPYAFSAHMADSVKNISASANAGFSNMQVFSTATTSATFTVPAGVNKIMVEVWGAGGGGAAGNVSCSGGGGGGYGKGIYPVIPNTNYTVTVGAGGSGGGPTPQVGTTGGSSSFGGLISATGGTGGTTGSTTSVGAGGISSGSPFSVSGGSGFTGCNNCSNFYLLPGGGDGGYGGSGGNGFSGAPGGTGVAPGGGGGGTVGPPNTGGTGAVGRVVVWW